MNLNEGRKSRTGGTGWYLLRQRQRQRQPVTSHTHTHKSAVVTNSRSQELVDLFFASRLCRTLHAMILEEF